MKKKSESIRIVSSDLACRIEERIILLKEIIKYVEPKIATFPAGKLHVVPGRTQASFKYYLRTDSSDKSGEYLDKSKQKTKEQFAQKKYYEELLRKTKKEYDALTMAKGKLDSISRNSINVIGDSLMDTYSWLSPGIKALIRPIVVDDETYIRGWMNCPYEKLPFDENDDSEYYSDKRERMRSKSELLIANALIKHNIPYKYECPIILKNGEKRYPDFTILDIKSRKEKYWEHLGKMDDMNYVSKNLCKLDEYKKLGIYLGKNLIISYEYSYKQLGSNEIEELIGTI